MTAYARRMFSDTVSYTDQLLGGITNSSSSMTLKDGSTFPTGSSGNWTATIDPNTASEEKVECTTRSGSTVNIGTRGLGGTTAVAHSANAVVIHTICGKDLDEANQAVVNTIGKVAAGGDLLYGTAAAAMTNLGIGTTNQVLSSSGSVPQWSTLLGLIETQFTADQQIISGTGSGSGELIDLMLALKEYNGANILGLIGKPYAAAGDLISGTGSGTGSVITVGSTSGVALRSQGTGSQPAWAAATSHAGHLSSPYSITGSLATFLTTSSLAVGTWLVNLSGLATTALATSNAEVQVNTGTATATFEGCTSAQLESNFSGDDRTFSLSFIATVTVAGTLVFQAINGSGTAQILAATSGHSYSNATGYTAVQL